MRHTPYYDMLLPLMVSATYVVMRHDILLMMIADTLLRYADTDTLMLLPKPLIR